MNQTYFSDTIMKALNALLGLTALAMLGYGFANGGGLQSLGLVLLMTSAIGYVGFRYSIEQQQIGVKPSTDLRLDTSAARVDRFSAAS